MVTALPAVVVFFFKQILNDLGLTEMITCPSADSELTYNVFFMPFWMAILLKLFLPVPVMFAKNSSKHVYLALL